MADSIDFQDTIIGGQGIEVELDETKVSKRKYNRGHQVNGVWVLGGVERTPERKFFAIPVPDRKAETLTQLITNYVAPGSVIYTDLWRGYSQISGINNYTHSTVNHSKNFKDPQTGVHTNTIEGTWAGMKIGIPIRNRSERSIEPYLWEFIWRRKQKDRLWDAFIEALAEIKYD